MNIQTPFETDLTVQSFAYVARQLARHADTSGPSALYEQILGEAERHRSALRLVQRDVLEMLRLELRKQALTKAEFHRLRETAAQALTQAEEAISLIAARYAPHRLAA